MSAPRLSICIATLNRASFIGETLESIFRQITEDVEVVIVDGASTDNTAEVVGRFQAQWQQLHYLRLPQKVGIDQDYCTAVEQAHGDYCWLFTDDDLLKPGAIKAVLEATDKNPSLIVVNAEVRTADLSALLAPRRVQIDADRIYKPTEPERHLLLAETGVYLSFIGGAVIKRDVWNDREKARYHGSEFIHIAVIFQSPLPSPALVLAHPWVIIRYGNAQWRPRHFHIWMFKWPGLIWSFPDYADWAKQRVIERHPWLNWQQLLLDRAMGHYSLVVFEKWIKPLRQPSFRRLLAHSIAAAPIRPLNLLARLYVKWIARKVPSIAMHDLDAWRKRQH